MLSVNLLSRGWSVLQAQKLLQAWADGLFWGDTVCCISVTKMMLFLQKAVPEDQYPPLHPVCDPQALVFFRWTKQQLDFWPLA